MRLIVLLVLCASVAVAQQVLTAATDIENARIKPLSATEQKAIDAYNAKATALPEYKAMVDAQEKFKKAAEALPEYQAKQLAGAAVVREAYRIMAERKLSSMEFKPQLNAKGNLEFIPLKQ